MWHFAHCGAILRLSMHVYTLTSQRNTNLLPHSQQNNTQVPFLCILTSWWWNQEARVECLMLIPRLLEMPSITIHLITEGWNNFWEVYLMIIIICHRPFICLRASLRRSHAAQKHTKKNLITHTLPCLTDPQTLADLLHLLCPRKRK